MGIVIDTSALIQVERLQRRRSLESLPEAGLVAAISIAELQIGAHRAESPGRRAIAEAFIQAVIDTFTVVPFDLPAALEHARLFDYLRRRGLTVGERDLQIGATALAGDHSLLTGNVREFERLPGLTVLPIPA